MHSKLIQYAIPLLSSWDIAAAEGVCVYLGWYLYVYVTNNKQ